MGFGGIGRLGTGMDGRVPTPVRSTTIVGMTHRVHCHSGTAIVR